MHTSIWITQSGLRQCLCQWQWLCTPSTLPLLHFCLDCNFLQPIWNCKSPEKGVEAGAGARARAGPGAGAGLSTTKNIVHQMWARQLGLRPGLGPDAMLSLQRGRCRCLKCTFWHAAWRTGWEWANGAEWSVWVAGVVEKILELHFKWIDGRREADAAAGQHQKLLAQPKLQSSGRDSGSGELGTRNEERELEPEPLPLPEPEPSWKVRLGQKIELNNGCGTIYDDAWTIPGSRHVCACVCVCVCFCMCTTCVTSRAKSPGSFWSRGKCRCRCIYHPLLPPPPSLSVTSPAF